MKIWLSLITIVATFCSFNLFSQNIITGKSIDSGREPVQGALISFYDKMDSTKIPQNTISDSLGHFSINIANGIFIFEINYHGEEVYSDTLSISTSQNLGDIILNTSSRTDSLAEFVVKADKPTVRLKEGNIVYTPNLKATNSALDVLKTTPLVIVRENAIEIVGKGTAPIMVNGKQVFLTNELLINYLNAIPASEVENITIAKNTMAEADAQHKSGFINIQLKRKMIQNGFDGSIYSGITKATYLRQNSGATFNLYKEKWRWSSMLNVHNGKWQQDASNAIHYSAQQINEKEKGTTTTTQPYVSTEIEYQPNAANRFTAGANYTYFDQQNQLEGQSDFVRSSRIDSSYYVAGENPQNQHNVSLNADYLHTYDSTGKSTNVSFAHFVSLFDRNQELHNAALSNNQLQQLGALRTANFQNMGITTFSVHNHLPTKWAQLSFGGKLSFISNKNNSEFYTLDAESWQADFSQFDQFNYFERTQALYIKGTKNIKKWDFVLGIRAEFTQTKGKSIVYNQEVHRRFDMMFPSGNVTYSPNAFNNFSLSYSRKVDRPGFYQVNPFVRFNNQYSHFSGNPFLQPYFSHNVDAMYMLKSRWIFNVSYQHLNNLYSEIEVTEPNSIQRIGTIKNFLDYDDVTFSINTNYNLFGRWQLYPTVWLSHSNFSSKDTIISNSNALMVYFSLYNQIRLDKKGKWYLDCSGSYSSPNNSGVTQMRSRSNVALGITHLAWNNKLRINLLANDIFKTNAMRYNSTVNGILRERYSYRDFRSVTLTLSYNFTKGKTKQFEENKANNQEEINRMK